MAARHARIALGLAAALIGSTSHGDDFSADIGTVRKLLQQDTAYTASERGQAETALNLLDKHADNMSAATFQLEVAHVFALANNGHTMLLSGLWPSQFNRIPVRTQVFADGVFIIDADQPALIGKKLIAIDDRDIELVRQQFAAYWGAVPEKRDDWLGYWLESPELLHAAGMAKANDRVHLRLQDAQGNGTEISLHAALQAPAHGRYAFFYRSRLVDHVTSNLTATSTTPLYLAEPDKLFRFASIPELAAFYLQLRYNTNVGEQKIADFVSTATAALKAGNSKHLIIDLRLDSGGDLNTTRNLMQTLPSLIPSDGRIFAITSGRTFSAGIASLGYLKQAAGDRVTIVGEPVGDGLEFWAEGSLEKLPVSNAEILIATERHNYMTGCPEPDCHGSIRKHPIRVQSLAPDILAPLRYVDYQGGIDPALRAIAAALKPVP